MSDEKTTPKRKRKVNGSDAEGDAASHAAECTGASRWQSRIIGEADVSPKLGTINKTDAKQFGVI